jgi:putative FmdB family regulatory protein
MPLYDYQCAKCGSVFEVEHAMSAKPKPKCPQCGSTQTAKVFSPAGVQFKGGGFYVTDSRGSAGNSAGTSKDITSAKGSGAGGTTAGSDNTAGTSPAPPATGAGEPAKPAQDTTTSGPTAS